MLPHAWLAAICTGAAYVQVTLGAQLRHVSLTSAPTTFRLHALSHIALAFVLATVVVWLAVMAHRTQLARPWVSRPAKWLVALLGVQLCLGGATWLVNYAAPAWLTDLVGPLDFAIPAGSRYQATIVTAHAATGSLIVATALLVALRSARTATILQPAGTPAGSPLRTAGDTNALAQDVPESLSQCRRERPDRSKRPGRWGQHGPDSRSRRAQLANAAAGGANR